MGLHKNEVLDLSNFTKRLSWLATAFLQHSSPFHGKLCLRHFCKIISLISFPHPVLPIIGWSLYLLSSSVLYPIRNPPVLFQFLQAPLVRNCALRKHTNLRSFLSFRVFTGRSHTLPCVPSSKSMPSLTYFPFTAFHRLFSLP